VLTSKPDSNGTIEEWAIDAYVYGPLIALPASVAIATGGSQSVIVMQTGINTFGAAPLTIAPPPQQVSVDGSDCTSRGVAAVPQILPGPPDGQVALVLGLSPGSCTLTVHGANIPVPASALGPANALMPSPPQPPTGNVYSTSLAIAVTVAQ
jgi:hypothetical protein